MNLPLALSSLLFWLNAFLLMVLTTAAAMCGPTIVRCTVRLERLVTNNEVAGFKFAVLGVVHAVLPGVAVIVVWRKFSEADSAVTQEAIGIVTVHRLADGLDAHTKDDLRQRLDEHVHVVINDDWPAVEQDRISPAAGHALTARYPTVLAVNPQSRRDTAVFSEMLRQLDVVTQGRCTRLVLVDDVMPGISSAVLLIGAFVALSFTFFFGSRSIRAQTMMTGILAATIFMVLFVVVEVDHPFTGAVSIGPEAMRVALMAAGQ